MFTVYEQLKALVFGGERGTEGKRDGPEKLPTAQDQPQKRCFSGEITSLTDTSGMIDHQVFFTPSVVMGVRRPQVGAMAHVTAERPHPLACWKATRVEVTEYWDSQESEERTTVIGFISKLSHTLAVVDCATTEVTFDPRFFKGDGFEYEVGDWVMVRVMVGEEDWDHDDGEEVEFVQPLREKEVKGRVTFLGQDYGLVDNDILFSLNGRGELMVGDEVEVRCVECRHRRASWRAVSMTTQSSSHPHYFKRSSHSPIIPIFTPSQTPRQGRDRDGAREREKLRRRLNGRVVPGEKPHRPRLLRLPHRLKVYPVPEDLAECVCDGSESELLSIRPQLTEPLCMKNYFSRFSSLLHLEEAQRELDMRNFDLFSVSLSERGQYLCLEVPGLAEGRPSLIRGDRVVASITVETEEERERQKCWEGYIHEIGRDSVLVMFAKEFHQIYHHHSHYDVLFQFTRTSFRRLHHAVEISHLLGSNVLFPGQPSPKQPLISFSSAPSDFSVVSVPSHLFNPVLNPRQRSAVKRILEARNRPSPYVVFGPPGTGKTVTLVEAVLQIHWRSRSSRVLACAPSNSAADLIMERLLASGRLREGELVRLNAIQRGPPPVAIAAHCMDTDSMDIAARSRVVVCTCVTAGALHALGLAVGHFSHVLVDEAGQAMEPEVLLPAGLLAGHPQGQLILAGDPQQLGPILASQSALRLGLSLSLLERLMDRQPYHRDEDKYSDHGCYDPLMVTKLVDNYRSHSSILSLYSNTFYDGELEPCADTSTTSLMCDWEGLPQKGFPLVFHGVMGKDVREGNSPSWFNTAEVDQVVAYVQSLIDNSTYAPKLSDIGIISPYRKQVEKIRWALAEEGVEGIKVGSVEEFQGQQRLVIIISTVRSTADLVTSDLQHNLGFLDNPRRFNVAISRAQALLVVIGNPHLLCQDAHWCVLVQYAVDNGGYIGCSLPQSLSCDPELDSSSATEDSSSDI